MQRTSLPRRGHEREEKEVGEGAEVDAALHLHVDTSAIFSHLAPRRFLRHM